MHEILYMTDESFVVIYDCGYHTVARQELYPVGFLFLTKTCLIIPFNWITFASTILPSSQNSSSSVMTPTLMSFSFKGGV